MFTNHANKRSQQRAIPKFIEDLLLLYGDHRHQRNNEEIFFFSKSSKHKMNQDLGKPIVKCLSKFFDVVMVKSDKDDVITVYWRGSNKRGSVSFDPAPLHDRRRYEEEIKKQKKIINAENIYFEEKSHGIFK